MAASARALLAPCPDPPGAYIHVPFCSEICPFCPYNKVRHAPARVTPYFRALHQEAEAWGEAVDGPFTSLYVGGGTPSLCLDELEPLIAAIPVAGERAIEVLPAHMVDRTAQRLRDMGFDYASLGVQSFDTAVLAHLGRRGDATHHRRAIGVALEHFDLVDVDLIFDAAFREPAVFLSDLRTCLELGVHQISTYPLMRFGYTPFGKAPHLPRREHNVLARAEALAHEYGYERRTVWTFTRPDTPSYTSITRPFYVGMGAGAASFLGSFFTVNHFSPDQYAEAIDAGRLPHARLWRMPAVVAALYWVFWQAYTGAVDLDDLERLFGTPRPTSAVLRTLQRLGVARRDGQRWVLTPRGLDVYHDVERWTTYHYIEPLWADMQREHRPEDRPRGLSERVGLGRRLQRRLPFLPA
jgi:menaquinone C8-methyltransferase